MSKFLEHKNACRAQKRATIGAAANDGMPASRGGAHQRAVRVLNDTKIRNDGRKIRSHDTSTAGRGGSLHSGQVEHIYSSV